MKKFFVIGSLVSLDLFNKVSQPEFVMTKRYFNLNFASLASLRPVSYNLSNVNKLKGDELNNLSVDLNKSLMKEIINSKCDRVLLDFNDIRFPLIRFQNGSILTESPYVNKSRVLTGKKYTIIKHKNLDFFEIWAASWDSFVRSMRNANILDILLINRHYWIWTEDCGYSKDDVYQMNIILHKIYMYCSKDVKDSQFLEYPREDMQIDLLHKYGIKPYHYTDDFYFRMYQQTCKAFSD